MDDTITFTASEFSRLMEIDQMWNRLTTPEGVSMLRDLLGEERMKVYMHSVQTRKRLVLRIEDEPCIPTA